MLKLPLVPLVPDEVQPPPFNEYWTASQVLLTDQLQVNLLNPAAPLDFTQVNEVIVEYLGIDGSAL